MNTSLTARVAELLRQAAAAIVVPRFQRLQHGDIEEKSPGEMVTIVDREVEALLTPALQALVPGSRVVGEEASALDARLLQGLDHGAVWLVDPLDGTSNFIVGRPQVAMMVALLRDGQTLAGWILDPLRGTLCSAESGAGAWQDDRRLQVSTPGATALSGIVKTRYLPDGLKQEIERRTTRLHQLHPGSNAAGVDYPAIVRGESDFAVYWRTLAWDHAPGTLLLTEAGGHVARWDGSPYRPGDDRTGLLVAASAQVWEAARHALLDD
ncbi:inositol monophosphatase family protein [Ideonella sp. BN130291]|uniref:inositol monophosphatase family protein n=1 Tax=Ideonella sp. BN130291 TaxID=3112940 RepID=UPI002E26181C|nr:inositol monophosphatase family protein [Ideonella sp. BN130291]